MMKILFRTILTISLCIGVSITSNAAVSVSDGSAFVTNAEFRSNLNNLSNRMAQLENSMDAKIDSLVSSYITRNGIWNGAGQELSDSVKNNQEIRVAIKFQEGNVGTKVQAVEQFKDRIVERTNKAGMVFGSFSYGNHHNGVPNNWYYGVYNDNNNQPGWIWDQNLCVTLSFFETEVNDTLQIDANQNPTNGNKKTVVEIGKALANYNFPGNIPITMGIALPEWKKVPFMFFVEKDKTLWWRWLDELSTYGTTALKCTSFEGSVIYISIDEIYIY